jgi:hypothetical protein
MQTIDSIATFLDRLEIGEPFSHGALTVVPLLGPSEPEPDWLTLPEAGAAVTVTEASLAGEVPTLTVQNDADRAVLLLDGEELIGAKQNRVLNTTVLVAAHATVRIPVSCVEQHRWSYRTPRFVGSDASLFASARAKKAARVSATLREHGRHLGDQQEIWRDVADKTRAHRLESPTGAMRDFYARYVDEMTEARRALAPRSGQVGALFAMGGLWTGLDVLAAPGLFARTWARLCVGYAAEAVGVKATGGRPKTDMILKAIAAARVRTAPAVGLGAEHRIDEIGLAGAALMVDGRVAHLMVFPTGMMLPTAF